MPIRRVVVLLCVVKNHSKITPIILFLYLKQVVSTPLSLFHASKVLTELRIHNFTAFRKVRIHLTYFRKLLIIKMQ